MLSITMILIEVNKMTLKCFVYTKLFNKILVIVT